jgi:hypothetical protein
MNKYNFRWREPVRRRQVQRQAGARVASTGMERNPLSESLKRPLGTFRYGGKREGRGLLDLCLGKLG